LTVTFDQSILFARDSVVSFISAAYLVDNKKVNVHIIDSNSESDEEMSNTTAKVVNKRRRTSQMIIAIIVLLP
jgi:undecaprenyl pyrophosphate synthase